MLLARLLLCTLAAALLGPPTPILAQTPPTAVASGPQTDVASYQLTATLDPVARQVLGRGRLVYRNPSPDTLSELWLHLYLNAFRSASTLWMREASGGPRGARSDPRMIGWIQLERLALADTGQPLTVEPADSDETIARVALPQALGPGDRLALELQWTVHLPRVFARTGYRDDFYMVGQWYPKLAVYDRGRWDTEPWHANAEFFADFGNYDLTLTVPPGYQTGASGVRLDSSAQADGTQVVRYRAERVTDVAWTAWPAYEQLERTVEAADQRVDLELLLPPEQRFAAERYLFAARAALDSFGRWYGAYPWPKLTIVVPPAGADGAGGMEYPTLITANRTTPLPFGLEGGVRLPETVTIHEIAHQWFPMQLQSNEAAEPWLDEGFADYLTIRLLERLYPPDRSLVDLPLGRLGYRQAWRGQFLVGDPRAPLDQPAWAFTPSSYGAVIYAKGSLALLSLEQTLGDDRLTAGLRAYADRWRWRHPSSADLRSALEEALGQPLGWFFDSLVDGRAVVEYAVSTLEPSRVQLERRGEAPFPVEVQLRLRDGQRRMERWDGAASRLELTSGDSPLERVTLDPDERLAVQLDRFDDRAGDLRDPAAALALANRWLGFVQVLLQLLGQIG